MIKIKIELMIYIYIAICVSMIAYNIAYVFILRHREKSLSQNAQKLKEHICDQIELLKGGGEISQNHKTYLRKKLDRSSWITAFDKALESISEGENKWVEQYIMGIYPVFEYLIHRYTSKNTLEIAYLPYILYKYNILGKDAGGKVTDTLLELLRSVNVYCRENTLKAIYSTGNPALAATALKIIDKNLSFHHPKLVCDGLLSFNGEKEPLRDALLESFDSFSVDMRVNILNYFRFGNIRCDSTMLRILKDEKENRELRFSAIRYFEKFPSEEAKPVILDLAENLAERAWEYQAIATSALKSYPDDATFRILVKNLSNSNWHVRQNSAISCEKLGYTYHDLINVFDGNDRYAREIMRYRLDRRNADEAVKI